MAVHQDRWPVIALVSRRQQDGARLGIRIVENVPGEADRLQFGTDRVGEIAFERWAAVGELALGRVRHQARQAFDEVAAIEVGCRARDRPLAAPGHVSLGALVGVALQLGDVLTLDADQARLAGTLGRVEPAGDICRGDSRDVFNDLDGD